LTAEGQNSPGTHELHPISPSIGGGPLAPGQVTAVVVSYNSARHFARLGQALSASSVVPARMLVVDNASTDDSVVCARTAGFEIREIPSNDGFGAACNVGLHSTATEFVLFSNPDALPAADAIERLLDALVHTPDAAIAGGATHRPPEARRFSRISGNLWHFLPRPLKSRLQRYRTAFVVEEGEGSIQVDFVEGSFILCRVVALRAVSGFDERFFLYSEEEDLARRLREHGWRTLLVPAACVEHGYSESSDGVDKAVMAPFRLHSLYWYYRKYHPRWYAEFARWALAACVLGDRTYRTFARRRQIYGPKAAVAPFRSMDSIRRDHERRRVGLSP
jgi:N-acetylglucosaminyl-diphospho-decaprenol L-rhamnosyltransferase